MTKTTPRSVTIITAKRTAPRANARTGKTPTHGDVLINAGKPSETWINGGAWQNNITGAELPTELPVSAFIGATVHWDELEITQAMLDAGGGTHIEVFGNGREQPFTTVGKSKQNVIIDFATLDVSDRTVNMTKLNLFKTQLAPKPVAAADKVAAPTRDTVNREVGVEEPVEEPLDNIDEPVINEEPVIEHQDIAAP